MASPDRSRGGDLQGDQQFYDIWGGWMVVGASYGGARTGGCRVPCEPLPVRWNCISTTDDSGAVGLVANGLVVDVSVVACDVTRGWSALVRMAKVRSEAQKWGISSRTGSNKEANSSERRIIPSHDPPLP